MKERRIARELALQAMYAQEISHDSILEVDQKIIEKSEISDELKIFARNIFSTATKNKDIIDNYIKTKSENWEFSRIAIVDRLILRMSICEFLYFDEIPSKVSISEGIEIAKKFSTEDSGAFVNGILDAVLHMIIKEKKTEAI